VAVILCCPCFFVFTGLKTEIGLINDPYLWKVTGAIILVAVVGKFLGSAGRKICWTELEDSDNWSLDEHKGLMELIVLT
jgi:Kef-type K+ transport system membrane component KefB